MDGGAFSELVGTENGGVQIFIFFFFLVFRFTFIAQGKRRR
jgi:hypothetical protein